MHRALAVFAAGSLLALCTSPAFSLGFGRSATASGLGQPLDFRATVTLGTGEVLEDKCATAEVLAGESRVEASQVRVRIDPATVGGPATLHVSTGVALVEPVVTVDVKLGCPPRLSRRFVALLDPPLVHEAREAAPASEPAAPPAPAARAASPRADGGASPAKRPAPRRATAASGTARSGSSAAARPRASVRPRSSAGTAAPAAAPRTGPRLSLDAPEAVGTAAAAPSAPASAAEPASPAPAPASVPTAAASEAAAAAARAAEERIRQLDEQLARMRRENAEMQDSLETLNARLRSAEAARDERWTWALGLLCLLLGLTVLWLLHREKRMRHDPAWWKESIAEPPDTPAVDSAFERGEPTAAAALPLGPPAVAQPPRTVPPAGPAPMAAAAPLPAAAPRPAPPAPSRADEPADGLSRMERRALAVEELIDLEQQADFFLVLGQDEAAIDLLMTHVRSSGGESPMPYLKLLEIYRRRGDAPAYGRIRERFNHRFNAYAPEWADDARPSTRTLEDYPRVIERLQQVWATPWQALDLLDMLLFRPDSTDISFDLPAYADLLFLYSVAGNLAEGGGPVTHVDLLLPLDGELSPSEIPAIERTTPHLPVPPSGWVPGELSLDLDLDLDRPGEPPAGGAKPR